MMQPTPHPRNNQSAFYAESVGHPGIPEHETIFQSGSVTVPEPGVTAEQISRGKSFLLGARNEISPLQVLSSIHSDPWCFSNMGDLAGPGVIPRFLRTSPELLSIYSGLRSQEGILVRLTSLLSFIGKPLPSAEFLKQFKASNNLIHEMRDLGLVNVRYHSAVIAAGDMRYGAGCVGVLITVSVSDLGKLVLDDIKQEADSKTSTDITSSDES
jgi:hypothetical protein